MTHPDQYISPRSLDNPYLDRDITPRSASSGTPRGGGVVNGSGSAPNTHRSSSGNTPRDDRFYTPRSMKGDGNSTPRTARSNSTNDTGYVDAVLANGPLGSARSAGPGVAYGNSSDDGWGTPRGGNVGVPPTGFNNQNAGYGSPRLSSLTSTLSPRQQHMLDLQYQQQYNQQQQQLQAEQNEQIRLQIEHYRMQAALANQTHTHDVYQHHNGNVQYSVQPASAMPNGNWPPQQSFATGYTYANVNSSSDSQAYYNNVGAAGGYGYNTNIEHKPEYTSEGISSQPSLTPHIQMPMFQSSFQQVAQVQVPEAYGGSSPLPYTGHQYADSKQASYTTPYNNQTLPSNQYQNQRPMSVEYVPPQQHVDWRADAKGISPGNGYAKADKSDYNSQRQASTGIPPQHSYGADAKYGHNVGVAELAYGSSQASPYHQQRPNLTTSENDFKAYNASMNNFQQSMPTGSYYPQSAAPAVQHQAYPSIVEKSSPYGSARPHIQSSVSVNSYTSGSDAYSVNGSARHQSGAAPQQWSPSSRAGHAPNYKEPTTAYSPPMQPAVNAASRGNVNNGHLSQEPAVDIEVDRELIELDQQEALDAAGLTEQDVEDIFSCARHGRVEEVEKILEKGMPVDVRDEYGNTLLTIACQNGNKRVAKACLRRAADLNARNYKGNTPLHYCYQYGYGDSLGQYLISKGANEYARNKAGKEVYDGI